MKKLFLAILLGFVGLAFGMEMEEEGKHKNCEGAECSQDDMNKNNDSQESTMEEAEKSTDSK